LVELAWIASSFGRCLLGLKRGGRKLLVCTGTWCSRSTCWALLLPVEDSSAAGSGRGGKTAQGSSLAVHRDDILLALHVKAKIAVHIYERWHQYTSQVVFNTESTDLRSYTSTRPSPAYPVTVSPYPCCSYPLAHESSAARRHLFRNRYPHPHRLSSSADQLSGTRGFPERCSCRGQGRPEDEIRGDVSIERGSPETLSEAAFEHGELDLVDVRGDV
jgi:hypothetical protein